MKSVLLLNDTSNELHIGSAAISSCIRDFLEREGATVYSGTYSNGRYDLPGDTFDLTVVNAEGTLSRNTARANQLADHILRQKGAIAVLNADICPEIGERIRRRKFDFVHYRREHIEAHQINSAAQILLPDLFFQIVRNEASFLRKTECITPKTYVLGDSHYPSDFNRLLTLAHEAKLDFTPQSMLVERISSTGYYVGNISRFRNRVWLASRDNLSAWRKRHSSNTFHDWLETLASSQGVLTGRFHHAIAAIALSIPVEYVESTTNKIANLKALFPESSLRQAPAEPGSHFLPCATPTSGHWDYSPIFSSLQDILEA